MRKTALLALALALILAASAWAGPSMDFKFIDVDEVKKVVDGKGRFVLVDARKPYEYSVSHLPGAINVGPEKFEQIARYLPPDKSVLIITYCRGYG